MIFVSIKCTIQSQNGSAHLFVLLDQCAKVTHTYNRTLILALKIVLIMLVCLGKNNRRRVQHRPSLFQQ